MVDILRFAHRVNDGLFLDVVNSRFVFESQFSVGSPGSSLLNNIYPVL